MPIVGFFIGWLTNWIAIKLLFFPRRKILGIQGVIPARKKQIAEKIADVSLNIMPKTFEKTTKIPVIGKYISKVFKKSVAKRIEQTDNRDIENIVMKVAKHEFRLIELIGGILGAVIGLIEVLIFSYF